MLSEVGSYNGRSHAVKAPIPALIAEGPKSSFHIETFVALTIGGRTGLPVKSLHERSRNA
jgi:hypothetical protein